MKVVLNEQQFKTLLAQELMEQKFREFLNESTTMEKVKDAIRHAAMAGIAFGVIAGMINKMDLTPQEKQNLLHVASAVTKVVTPIEDEPYEKQIEKNIWLPISHTTTATVYNAVPEQCNADIKHTASNFTLNLDDVLSHRIIAMERTMMKKYGIKYGDIVLLDGVGQYNGVWKVEDTMNVRFAGMEKIDILVPNNIKRGLWKNVTVYVLNPNNPDAEKVKRKEKQSMAPSI